VRRVPVTTYRQVTERIPQQVSVQVCKMVEEEVVHRVPVTTCRMAYEERVEQIPVQVCKMVAVQSTVRVPRVVEKQIPVTYSVRTPRTVCMRVPVVDEPCAAPVASCCGGAVSSSYSYSEPAPIVTSPAPASRYNGQPTPAEKPAPRKENGAAGRTQGTNGNSADKAPALKADEFVPGPVDEESPDLQHSPSGR